MRFNRRQMEQFRTEKVNIAVAAERSRQVGVKLAIAFVSFVCGAAAMLGSLQFFSAIQILAVAK
jgi:hypothetical protein